MPEGKKNTVPAPVRDEDGYSAKTHLHQPVQETATVAATALLADAPEGVPYPGAKPQKILDVENRVLTAQVLEILERVTPVSKRRARKTYGML